MNPSPKPSPRSSAGRGRVVWLLILVAAYTATLAACNNRSEVLPATAGEARRDGPATAQWDLVEQMKADLVVERHPADGGGRAWLESDPDAPTATARTPGRWTIVYEAGPLGVAVGGMIYLQVSPFWGWSTPQVTYPTALGYTQVSTDAKGVKLEARELGPQLLGMEVGGRDLAPGEQVRIVYGAGKAGAMADRYAERGSRFWIAVDGDGDGVRKVLADSPSVDVAPGLPARLELTLPTTARPTERVRLTIAGLDRMGNAGVALQGKITFPDPPPGLDMPREIHLGPDDAARKTIEIVAREAGIYRIRAVGPHGLSAESNPMVVSQDGRRVLWGDLHGHSQRSDGTATPEDYFLYARDVAALDVVALTDHDHWGMLFLDQHPDMWEEIRAQTRRFHAPGRFVTLLGYEWTSWIHGHRHVLYFGDDGDVYSSMDPLFESPLQLWAALQGRDVLTIAHHSAGGPIAVNWDIPPDPELEPVTEIVSVHGSSEAADSTGIIYSARADNFVRDALGRGYRLGFVGSGDGHDGHPGLTHLGGAPSGGLAAILSEELTRQGVLEALRARRVYATNGPRILLRVDLDGQPMGSFVPATTSTNEGQRVLTVRAAGAGPIAEVQLIRSGKVTARLAAGGKDSLFERFAFADGELRSGEYLYVRLLQEGGGLAWSSPIFVR